MRPHRGFESRRGAIQIGYNFPFCFHASIVVVALLGSGDSKTYINHRGFQGSVRPARISGSDKILTEDHRLLFSVYLNAEACVLFVWLYRTQRRILKIGSIIARRFEPHRLECRSHEPRRNFMSAHSCAAALKQIIRQEKHIRIRPDLVVEASSRARRPSKRDFFMATPFQEVGKGGKHNCWYTLGSTRSRGFTPGMRARNGMSYCHCNGGTYV